MMRSDRKTEAVPSIQLIACEVDGGAERTVVHIVVNPPPVRKRLHPVERGQEKRAE